jgi:hypothetical protein
VCPVTGLHRFALILLEAIYQISTPYHCFGARGCERLLRGYHLRRASSVLEGNAMRTFKDLVSFARSGASQGVIDGVVWTRRPVNPREAIVSTDGRSWLVHDLLRDPIVGDIVRQATEKPRSTRKPTTRRRAS